MNEERACCDPFKTFTKTFKTAVVGAIATNVRFVPQSRHPTLTRHHVSVHPVSTRPHQARSEYSIVSVLMMTSSSCPTKGGTMTFTPLSRIAGLKLLAAV